MTIRLITENDYYKNYMNLINYFTKNPRSVSFEEFKENLTNNIFVIEKNNIIIASIKLLIEKKLHNNFVNMCHIEDFVILEKYRGQGYGKQLMDFAKKYAKENNCYKIVLNCNDDIIEFYKKQDFIVKGTEMSYYLQSS